MDRILQRMLRAAKLETALYEEVEHDENATSEALVVVVLSSVAGGLGAVFFGGLVPVVMGVISGVVGWLAWSGVILLIGSRLFPEEGTEADLGQLLRTMGYAQAPGLLRVAGIVPVLGWPVVFAANVWMIATTVVAVRQALDFRSTARAVAVVMIGWVAMLVVSFVLGGFALMP